MGGIQLDVSSIYHRKSWKYPAKGWFIASGTLFASGALLALQSLVLPDELASSIRISVVLLLGAWTFVTTAVGIMNTFLPAVLWPARTLRLESRRLVYQVRGKTVFETPLGSIQEITHEGLVLQIRTTHETHTISLAGRSRRTIRALTDSLRAHVARFGVRESPDDVPDAIRTLHDRHASGADTVGS